MTKIKHKESRALSGLLNEIKVIKKSSADQNTISLLDEVESRLLYDKKTVGALLFLSFSFALFSLFFVIMAFNSERKVNLLQNDAVEKAHIIDRLERSDSLFNLYMNVDSVGTFSHKHVNGKGYTYRDLVNENDSLISALWKSNRKLVLAYDNYDITFKQIDYSENGKNYTTTEIIAPKVDSAMILLDIYRGRLKYDKETNRWYVDIKK